MNLTGEGIKAEDIPHPMAIPADCVMCLLRLFKIGCVRKPIYLLYSGV